jgi:hypothetical protein
LSEAQAQVRSSYRSSSIGQIYSGTIWVLSAVGWSLVDTTLGILVLLVGGFFIYPVTVLFSRALGHAASIPADNPLREAGFTIPIVGALGIPVAGVAALHDIDLFYPAFMVIMGAHYLPFSHLYGMRIFLGLGAGMWAAGLVIGLWFADWAVLGAWATGLAVIAAGAVAEHRHRAEFG